jgi:hypothetical protein
LGGALIFSNSSEKNMRTRSARFGKLLVSLTFVLLASWPAHAVEVGGVHFDEKTNLVGNALQLNGAGLRSKLFFKIYAIALYLPQKTTGTDAVLNSTGPRRVHIITLRELSAEQLSDALIDALKDNLNEQEMAKLAPRINAFRNTMLSVGTAPERTTIYLDYLPATGTRLTIGKEQKGGDVAGEDFYQALLRIWLGNAPIQADIKEKLSGK